MNNLRVTKPTCQVIYISVHIGLQNKMFDFRPYDSHHDVHCRYFLSLSGKEYVSKPYPVMFIDLQSNVIDILLGAMETVPFRKCHQNRGKQLKPLVIDTLQGLWIQGTIDKLKYLGIGIHGSICLYFDNCFTLPDETKQSSSHSY